MYFRAVIWMSLISAAWLAAGRTAVAEITLSCRQEWSAVFAESDVTFSIEIRSDQNQPAVVSWQYMASDRRTISRGEREVALSAADPVAVPITLSIPALRPEVIWESWLDVRVSSGGGRADAAETSTWRKLIRIFPRDAFASLRPALDDRPIQLYDPGGETAKVLAEAKVPQHQVRDPAQFVGEGSVILVGEGLSFDKVPGVAETLVKLASSGGRVLCLAPRSGNMAIAGGAAAGDMPESAVLKGRSIIKHFDERLDANAWPRNGRPPASRFALFHRDNQLYAAVAEDALAWPWLELRFAPAPRPAAALAEKSQGGNEGRLIVCGFRLIENWDDGPTPRHLLARILEQLYQHGDSADRRVQ